MTNYEIITLIIRSIGTLVVIVQIGIAIISYKAIHERQKKQATIVHVREIRPIYNRYRLLIEKKVGNDVLTEKLLPEVLADPEIHEYIKDLLSYLEHTSEGMNTGVFDKDLWYRMSGTYLIRIYHRLRVYIKHVQKNCKTTYTDFEAIIQEFESRKNQKPDNRGVIKHS